MFAIIPAIKRGMPAFAEALLRSLFYPVYISTAQAGLMAALFVFPLRISQHPPRLIIRQVVSKLFLFSVQEFFHPFLMQVTFPELGKSIQFGFNSPPACLGNAHGALF